MFYENYMYMKVIRISHGSKKGNTDPIDDVYFYKKNEPWKAISKKDLEVRKLCSNAKHLDL